MLITLSRRTAIWQSVAEVTGGAPLGAVSNRFNFSPSLYHEVLGRGFGRFLLAHLLN